MKALIRPEEFSLVIVMRVDMPRCRPAGTLGCSKCQKQ
jgi:hypothetical protein